MEERRLGWRGARAVVQSPAAPGLRRLAVVRCNLFADGARVLARARKALVALEELDLTGNSIGPEGARALAGARLPALRRLTWQANVVGVEGDALLRARFGS
jgi:hypothetical protein